MTDGHTDMSGHVSPKRMYVAIFATLLVLTVVTIGAAFINLGSLNFPVALGIAIHMMRRLRSGSQRRR